MRRPMKVPSRADRHRGGKHFRCGYREQTAMISASAIASSGSSPSLLELPSRPGPSPILSGSSTISSEAPGDAIDPAGASLASKLHAFERLLDAAYAAGGELDAAIVRARFAHRLSAVVGQTIFDSFDAASSALVQARGHAVKGHRLLEQLARRLDVPHAYGDEGKDPSDGKVFTGG